MDKNEFFDIWPQSKHIAPNISYQHLIQGVKGEFSAFPDDLPGEIKSALIEHGINQLYSHQIDAWKMIKEGKNLVISTGTSSGKSLCYILPILDSLISNPNSTALLLFPTKALTNDQSENIQHFLGSIKTLGNGSVPKSEILSIYDGDTPGDKRIDARTKARVLFTNPDMLHLGILPHHTLWKSFIHSLRFVIIDEIHLYRGVFGSHLANIIRRLKRICHFYDAYPQFILTSATIANPAEHAGRLTEEEINLIGKDGSPHGSKHFILYNPPLTNPELGIRRGVVHETSNLCQDFIDADIQTITFSRSRREVELILRNLLERNEEKRSQIKGYRSGYLPKDRRAIESGLRSGEVRMVVATNALELGIDIGGMDAIIMVGYPGTIAAMKQQSGRAGRRLENSLAMMVASANPLDQFLITHPDYIFDRSTESALIDPNNLLILLQHIRCATFELPFKKGDNFGSLKKDMLDGLLKFLEESQVLFTQNDKYFWMADKYPASEISIRSASNYTINLHVVEEGEAHSIGQIDYQSALWMVHPGAVYMHEGQSYLVKELDLNAKEASLSSFDLDYYTLPQIRSEISLIELNDSKSIKGGQKNFGELLVSEQVVGYKRIRWMSQEILGIESIDYLPSVELRTTGYWFSLDDDTVDRLRELKLWLSDPNEYGTEWSKIRRHVRERDKFTCQACGAFETTLEHHVHHKIPFKQFTDSRIANQLDNLVTLCSSCHMRAEMLYRIRSSLSGLRYAFSNIAPLFLMCDSNDLGSTSDPQCNFANGKPTIILYDNVPGGIGLSKSMFDNHAKILASVYELITSCQCTNGCPSCVGPSGKLSESGKKETLALIDCLIK